MEMSIVACFQFFLAAHSVAMEIITRSISAAARFHSPNNSGSQKYLLALALSQELVFILTTLTKDVFCCLSLSPTTLLIKNIFFLPYQWLSFPIYSDEGCSFLFTHVKRGYLLKVLSDSCLSENMWKLSPLCVTYVDLRTNSTGVGLRASVEVSGTCGYLGYNSLLPSCLEEALSCFVTGAVRIGLVHWTGLRACLRVVFQI
jgi:hypothetical protein